MLYRVHLATGDNRTHNFIMCSCDLIVLSMDATSGTGTINPFGVP